jgi:hypothetical protein
VSRVQAVGDHTVTTQPGPQRRTPLHPRLTVARADTPQRREIATALGGSVVGQDEVRAAATDLAAERSGARRAHRSRLDAAAERLRADAAAAADRLADLETRRQRLLDGARWAMQAADELPALRAAVVAAGEERDAREAELRSARTALDRVLEQRSAATAALEDADRQLGDLVGVGMDETSLRRELEAAGRAVQASEEAHRAAVERVAELEEEVTAQAERAARLHELLEASASDDDVDERAVQLLRMALDDWTEAARHAGPDPDAQALAGAFSDLAADLAEQQARTGARPDEDELRAAEERAAAAAAELDRIDAEAAGRSLTERDRAELEAAHAAVLEAEDRAGRRIGGSGARKRLDAARAAERAILDRHGFGTYLEVTLTGGKAVTSSAQRLAAERTYLAAKAHREALRRALQPTPELEYLESERARLTAHAVDLLGYDPGADVISELRHLPLVPRPLVATLRAALAEVGVAAGPAHPAEAAEAWLADHARRSAVRDDARARADEIRTELRAAEVRARDLAVELADARSAEARTAEALEMAGRTVGTFENELSVRTGEENTRLKRFAAAEQLRHQIETLTATLATAEQEARAHVDHALRASSAAESSLDRAAEAVAEIDRRATALAKELPADSRPTGDVLDELVALSEGLRLRAEDDGGASADAERALAEAHARVEAALEEAARAGDGSGDPWDEDVVDAFEQLLRDQRAPLLVLDEPFADAGERVRKRLLDALLARSADTTVVLLTVDPATVGWAIELPADQGSVAAAESLLNLGLRPADTDLGRSSVVDLPDGVEARGADPTAPTGPAPRWAGRR